MDLINLCLKNNVKTGVNPLMFILDEAILAYYNLVHAAGGFDLAVYEAIKLAAFDASLEAQIGVSGAAFRTMLANTGAVLSGSSVLRAIYSDIEPGDLDIYIGEFDVERTSELAATVAAYLEHLFPDKIVGHCKYEGTNNDYVRLYSTIYISDEKLPEDACKADLYYDRKDGKLDFISVDILAQNINYITHRFDLQCCSNYVSGSRMVICYEPTLRRETAFNGTAIKCWKNAANRARACDKMVKRLEKYTVVRRFKLTNKIWINDIFTPEDKLFELGRIFCSNYFYKKFVKLGALDDTKKEIVLDAACAMSPPLRALLKAAESYKK